MVLMKYFEQGVFEKASALDTETLFTVALRTGWEELIREVRFMTVSLPMN